jgi:hypothetical protein
MNLSQITTPIDAENLKDVDIKKLQEKAWQKANNARTKLVNKKRGIFLKQINGIIKNKNLPWKDKKQKIESLMVENHQAILKEFRNLPSTSHLQEIQDDHISTEPIKSQKVNVFKHFLYFIIVGLPTMIIGRILDVISSLTSRVLRLIKIVLTSVWILASIAIKLVIFIVFVIVAMFIVQFIGDYFKIDMIQTIFHELGSHFNNLPGW